MGTILEYRLPRGRRPANPVSLNGPREHTQILFFIGVRYSRPDDDENRSLRNAVKRRRKCQNMSPSSRRHSPYRPDPVDTDPMVEAGELLAYTDESGESPPIGIVA